MIRTEGARTLAAAGDGRWLELLRAQIDDGPELEGTALAQRVARLTSDTTTAPA